MRACFIKDLSLQDSYQLKGDVAHHLINVVRVEKHEEILLLDGKGQMVKTIVKEILKKEIHLHFLSSELTERTFEMDLALGIPKKDAFELSLKQAVELGFRKIYLVRSQYSQTKIPENERIENLLVSGLEQSNAPFMPEIVNVTWKEIPYTDYSQVLMMDSQHQADKNQLMSTGPKLLIVGPEGGFSPEESSYLHQLNNMKILRLPTPILRTPTAVATGAGILLGTLLD